MKSSHPSHPSHSCYTRQLNRCAHRETERRARPPATRPLISLNGTKHA